MTILLQDTATIAPQTAMPAETAGVTTQHAAATGGDSTQHVVRRLTPADVLAALPADATPEQQDSAIQANFKPAEVRYGDRPDTLHMPGHEVAESTGEVHLPGFYDPLWLSDDTLLHTQAPAPGYGVPGDPVPYAVRNDDLITGLLLLCVVLVAVAMSNSRRFIVRQLKDFLYLPHHTSEPAITETSSEVRFQFFLMLNTCLQLSIFQYFYTQRYIGETFVLESEYQLIAIFFAMFAGYFAVKMLLYTAVNVVFFNGKKNLQWQKSQLFITSTEGVALLPVVLLQVYFDLPIRNVVIYFIIVLILVKMLTFYKCYFIFFRRSGIFLQIILYFCALEIVPIAAFWGALVITGNHLNVNF